MEKDRWKLIYHTAIQAYVFPFPPSLVSARTQVVTSKKIRTSVAEKAVIDPDMEDKYDTT
jgi:hypothetical protein